MRKLFLLTMLLFSTIIWAQKGYTISNKNPSNWAPLADGEVNIHSTLTNNAVNAKDSMFWVEYLDANTPAAWSFGLCTNLQCYLVSATTGLKESFYTAQGNVTDLKCTQSFGSTPVSGKGYARFLVYREGMKNLADTIYFNGNAPATGMKNVSKAMEVTISPNPVKNELVLNLSDINITSISIINIVGKEVLMVDIKSFKKIDVSELPNGIYFLNIKKGELSFNKKFIVSK